MNSPTPEPSTYVHKSKPPAILLVGEPGTGKTTSVVSFLEAGIEVFLVITDPGGEEALLDAAIDRGLDLSKIHWAYIPATAHKWATAENIYGRINSMSYESLGAIKVGVEKSEYKQAIRVMSTLNNFVDQHGVSYGSVDQWGPDRALIIDSMTGMNKMFKRLVVGAKPTLHQGEWGTAMEAEEQFLDLLVGNTKCFLVVIAHLEKERDELTGGFKLMASFLGSKLAPKIPHMFSDVVMAKREGDKFMWSTTENNVALKARTLPLSANIPPSFQQVVDGWKKREAAINAALAPKEESASVLTESVAGNILNKN